MNQSQARITEKSGPARKAAAGGRGGRGVVAASAVPAGVWSAVIPPSQAAGSGVVRPAETLGRPVPPCPALTAAAGLAAGVGRALLQAAGGQHGRVPKDRSWPKVKAMMGKVDQFLDSLGNINIQ